MKAYAIEGNSQRLDGGAMFGNAPKAMWEKWIKPDELNRIPLACRCLLLKLDNGKNILFEAGVGAFFEPKFKDRYGIVETEHRLLDNLKKEGLSHEDIDAVILSHMHFDHVGGIVSAYSDGEPHLLFPNAKFYTSKEQWERAHKPHFRDRASYIPMINELLEASGRLVLIDGETHPDLDFGVRFTYVNGHTPGLMVSHIEMPEGPLVFVSDLIPGKPWTHLPITMGYDRYPEQGIEEKQVLLESLEPQEGRLFYTHDPEFACAVVRKDEKGRYYGDPIDISNGIN
ncbi:MAG: MBL fold hydrolase [Waddliaceae bacterium]|nr:MBL fold hydrolase [Waddliaceae bacterium]